MFAVGTDLVHAARSPASKVKAWQNVVLTPGRIPGFFVPPKLQLSVSPRYRRGKDDDEYSLLSTSSPEEHSPASQSPVRSALGSPRIPAKLRFTPKSNRKRRKQDMCDPTQAAMSLQHVDKVTTPYGFRTLAASPTVSRRESLFHKRSRCRRGVDSSGPEASPLSQVFCDSPRSNMAIPPAKLSLEPCCSPQKPERKGLQKILSNPRAALKSLTPGRRKNNPRDVL